MFVSFGDCRASASRGEVPANSPDGRIFYADRQKSLCRHARCVLILRDCKWFRTLTRQGA